ncbi:hypothetical protein K0U27_00660 [archaeon]|nr:hypothetical protein [archaeon]
MSLFVSSFDSIYAEIELNQDMHPISVAVDSENKVYVADHDNHKIYRYNDIFAKTPEWELDLGSFMYPSGIALSSDEEHIFVYARGNVQEYDIDMKECVAAYTGDGKMSCGITNSLETDSWRYKGIVIDSFDNLFFVQDSKTILKFVNGTHLPFSITDQAKFENISDIAIHENGALYAASFSSKKIVSMYEDFEDAEIIVERSTGAPSTLAVCGDDLYYSIYDERGIVNHFNPKFTNIEGPLYSTDMEIKNNRMYVVVPEPPQIWTHEIFPKYNIEIFDENENNIYETFEDIQFSVKSESLCSDIESFIWNINGITIDDQMGNIMTYSFDDTGQMEIELKVKYVFKDGLVSVDTRTIELKTGNSTDLFTIDSVIIAAIITGIAIVLAGVIQRNRKSS